MSLAELIELCRGRALVALTGAGCSTESGIPGYRGEGAPQRSRPPVTYQAFLKDERTRRRFWARSAVGFERFRGAEPNAAHRALAGLEACGRLDTLITQNVDRLHHRAGHQSVIELHGSLHRVRCLECGESEARSELQARLLAQNPGLLQRQAQELPDGDAELDEADELEFEPVDCRACGGVLKPDVVFFGENVPKATVEAAYEALERAEVFLVVGSSLAVFSGFRFVRRARQREIPVAIVNLGRTRGDELAQVRVEGRAGEVVAALERALSES